VIGECSKAAASAVLLRRKRRAITLREGPRIIVIGGQCRGVGKTAMIVDVIRAFPNCDLLALKITQHHTDERDCSPYVFWVEVDGTRDSDTSRFIAAGAARAFLLRVRPRRFREAMPELGALAGAAENVIIESNTVLEYLAPTLTIFVLDPQRADFKTSARKMMPLADAFVIRSAFHGRKWPGVDAEMITSKPHFLQPIGAPMPVSVRRIVRRVLGN